MKKEYLKKMPLFFWGAWVYAFSMFSHASLSDISYISDAYESGGYAYFRAPELDAGIGAGCAVAGAAPGSTYNIRVIVNATNEGFLAVLRTLSVSVSGSDVKMLVEIELAGTASCADPMVLPYPTRVIVKDI